MSAPKKRATPLSPELVELAKRARQIANLHAVVRHQAETIDLQDTALNTIRAALAKLEGRS